MKLLRETIRKLIMEFYRLSPSDVRKIQQHGRRNMDYFDTQWPEVRIRKHWDDKGTGVQGTEPIKRDIDVMKQFNQIMNGSPEGKQIIKDFQSGTIQILHSIEYQGLESSKKEFQRGDKPFTTWLQRFGRKGKDMLSVVASPKRYNESPQISRWMDQWNASYVYDQGWGFLMKGYPAFIANEDVMSQTLSAVPYGLEEFQKNSGLAKRASRLDYRVTIEEWLDGIGSEETLLDNWEVIGIYIGMDIEGRSKYDTLIEDAKNTGLPIYQVQQNRSLERIK